jgi:hypothetical protein
MNWSEGKLATASILSLKGCPCRVRYGNEVRNFNLPKGKRMQWNENTSPADAENPSTVSHEIQ